MKPRIEPHLLEPNAAQLAVNTRLWSGGIGTFKEPGLVTTLSKSGTIRSIYRFGKKLDDDKRFWFHFLNDADVTRGPIPDDTQERTYYTEAGQPPMVTDATMATSDGLMPSAGYRLGVPAPTAPAAVTVTQVGKAQGNLERQSCVLAYTFVSGWGEEGPPNKVSNPFDAMTGDKINVTGLQGPPTGAYNIKHKRLYISVTDLTGSATLRFWKEIAAGETRYSADLDMTALGEALPQNAMLPPPADLFGIMAHPGGFLVGFSGQQVYRSETFKPYGWPYFSPLADDIVGGAILGQATVICTKGGTYMATQADPVTFTPILLDGWQPCVSKRSITILQGGVIYASPDGLVGVDQTGVLRVLTEGIMTRDEWQGYKPESMLAVAHDGRVWIFYDNGTRRGGLILEVAPDGVGLIETDIHATAAYADERRDALFLVVGPGKLHKWDGGRRAMSMVWKSRCFIAERPQNIGAAMVIAEKYPVTFELRAIIRNDGGEREIVIKKTVANGRPFRMGGNYRAREFSFTVSGVNAVREVVLASTLGNITAE
ncbi:hypothetical protein ACMHYO_16255 [Allopusillimonas ginsengisoli]|uniref:hypothetical protein n=1 Tax=Allopusillimonas ginsengisoli TaxID=453575 RepID=UPI0039C01838